MASAAEAAGEASVSAPEAREKPNVVRVKRKPSQTRPDAFWLEINERPVKKAMLDFSSLSISEPPSSSTTAKASEEPRVNKLLVQHIETVHHSEAVEDVLHSLSVIFILWIRRSADAFLPERLAPPPVLGLVIGGSVVEATTGFNAAAAAAAPAAAAAAW